MADRVWEWTNDRTHGQQFKARFLKTSAPTTAEGIEYLASGIAASAQSTPEDGRSLRRAYSASSATSPDRLREVPGIGPVRAARIIKAWADQKVVREIMVFLHARTAWARLARGAYLQDLWRRCRAGHVGRPVSPGPQHSGHRLQDRRRHRHAPRHRADRHDPDRASYALSEAMDDSPAVLPTEQPTLAVELLAVEAQLVTAAWMARWLRIRSEMRPASSWQACMRPSRIAELAACLRQGTLLGLDPDHQGPPLGPSTSPWQQADQAVTLALASKVLVITGGPGGGKTTIINTILTHSRRQGCEDPALRPDRPRAAKRMSETTGLERGEIHLLEVDPRRGVQAGGQENPLDCDLLVIDKRRWSTCR